MSRRIRIEIPKELEVCLGMEGLDIENSLRASLISLSEIGNIGFANTKFLSMDLEESFCEILWNRAGEIGQNPSRMAGLYIFEFFYQLHK